MGKKSTRSDEGDHFVDTLQKYINHEDDVGFRSRRVDMLICLKTEWELHPDRLDDFLGLVMYFIHDGFYVPKFYLETCIAYIHDVLSGKRVENGWNEECYPERLKTLESELKEIIARLDYAYDGECNEEDN